MTTNLEIGGSMSKISIAIGAFTVGLFCSSLFSATQSEHPGADTPNIPWPDMHGMVFNRGSISNAGAAIKLNLWASPFFNSLDHMPVFKEYKFSSTGQSLDGLNCEDCQFKDASLKYGGGVVNLKGSSFSGTTELQLEGAAANTVALLEFLNAIPEGGLTYKLPINKPIIRTFNSAAKPNPGKVHTPKPALPPAEPKKWILLARILAICKSAALSRRGRFGPKREMGLLCYLLHFKGHRLASGNQKPSRMGIIPFGVSNLTPLLAPAPVSFPVGANWVAALAALSFWLDKQ